MKKEAIVLLNMGGPNNLDEVELFLKNMFNDPNILTVKSTLFRKLIAFMITAKRKKASQEIYKTLGGKSPIVALTREIVAKLQERVGDNVVVDFAMRYTPPFADEVAAKLKQNGVEDVFLLPMYPQYSSTTTLSSLQDFNHAAKKQGLSTDSIESYYDNELYNEAILERIKEQVVNGDYRDYELVFSAHGLPQKIVDAGDPYEEEITKNVSLLKEMMYEQGMHFNSVQLAYQSKVGPMKWLEPSLESMLQTMEGKKVVVYPIAFTVDNSETEYELAIEYAQLVKESGLKEYKVCRCVNDHPQFIEALFELYEAMK
jgi:protoporphyrin/coproporphyrin ferrochelatase